MSVSIKITLPLFTILFVSWCAIGTPIEKSERLITNQDVTLSEEQRQLLQHMRNEMIVTDQLSESCRLVSEGNEKAALTKLQSIEWSNTWLKISKNGVHNDGIIDYFKKRLQLGSEGCDVFTQDLIRGVY
ncbi:hypothetical protein [Escherichia coli]|uniref:hypothetical protein n=1 Tax=Escherichia coli TaxID=562 RepID=UPI0015CA0F5E|nr:hypothetical protein [Escherichia coli]EIO1067999.1 hypothetical protein [Escherichia coli]EJD8302858.1 hypothetical protein [Escherichia coli]NYR93480.1 hypothetical protein [Escherichia coli]NYS04522.1 hypothetical protein [Escherichia coli]